MKQKIGILNILVLSFLIIGCTNQIEVDKNNEEMFCAEYYDPVCGVDGVTYSNDCFAEINGVDVAYTGECGKENALSVSRICTREYNPVCGLDGVTYGNPCMAGKMIISPGACEEELNKIANPASEYCSEKGYISEIITQEDGSQIGNCVSFNGESCEEWAFYRGECTFKNEEKIDDLNLENVYCTEEQKRAEMCTMEYFPVCGDDGMTYGNKCVACSSGNIEYYINGEC